MRRILVTKAEAAALDTAGLTTSFKRLNPRKPGNLAEQLAAADALVKANPGDYPTAAEHEVVP